MKKKQTNDSTRVKGFYINELIRGFFGDHNEGKIMLRKMGLSPDAVPFSVAVFLQNQRVFWLDKNGNRITISFKLKHNQLECFGSYLIPKSEEVYQAELKENPKADKFFRKKKSIRLFREWSIHEDPEVIARLESEAIGDCCMRCIYEILIE